MSSSASVQWKADREIRQQNRPRPDSFVGRAGRGQRNPGQGTGEAVGNPADLDRRPAARQRVPGYRSWARLPRRSWSAGELVPDSLVNEMVAVRLQEPDTVHGYILDGFPRTLPQASWLDGRLAAQTSVCRWLLSASMWTIISYCAGLRGAGICPVCQTIYNVYCNPPSGLDFVM